jgi:hypothetical protein
LPATDELGVLSYSNGSSNLQRSRMSAGTVRVKGMKRLEKRENKKRRSEETETQRQIRLEQNIEKTGKRTKE